MQLSKDVDAMLAIVAAAMASARDDWWIIGSTAVALHGVSSVEVRDIDVLLSEHDAVRILPTLGLAANPGIADGRFQSAVFARSDHAPLPIEWMAGLQYLARGRWTTLAPATRQQIIVAEARIFVPAREELRAILERFGRPKDIARARLLADR